jgi:polysaccharide deacetylase family protein (PEP-CTERM system associated)
MLPARDPATVSRLLELLQESDQHATFFATGRFAAEFPAVIGSIAAAGHEVASHSYEHLPVARLGGPVNLREDLRRSLAALQDASGQTVLGYRAPFWSVPRGDRRWLLETLASEGLLYDSSRFPWGLALGSRCQASLEPRPVRLDSGGLIWEIPANVLALGPLRLPTAGGFYLRLLPEVVTRAALHQAEAARRPGLVYLHPYDLDPGCPRLPASLLFRLMRFHRLGRTWGVLRRLLQSFRFTSIRDWLQEQTARP